MSKKLCDITLKKCFRAPNSVNPETVIAQEVIDPVTKQPFTIQYQELPEKIIGIPKTDPVTGERYFEINTEPAEELTIPAFDNTFIGLYNDGSDNFIGRYNYITGEKLLAIPAGNSDRFLAFNFKNGYYYIFTDTHPDTEVEGSYICAYDGEGNLLNAIDDDDFISNAADSFAVNYSDNSVVLIRSVGGAVTSNNAVLIYSADLSVLQQSYPAINEGENAATKVVSSQDKILLADSGTLSITALDQDYEIAFELTSGDFTAGTQGFYLPDARPVIKTHKDNYYLFVVNSDDNIDLIKISSEGEVTELFTDLSPIQSDFVIDKTGNVYRANLTNFSLEKIDNAGSVTAAIPAPVPAAGFTGPGDPYLAAEKIIYSTWETFAYTYNLEDEEVNEVEYGEDSFQLSNQTENVSYLLKPYPGI